MTAVAARAGECGSLRTLRDVPPDGRRRAQSLRKLKTQTFSGDGVTSRRVSGGADSAPVDLSQSACHRPRAPLRASWLRAAQYSG